MTRPPAPASIPDTYRPEKLPRAFRLKIPPRVGIRLHHKRSPPRATSAALHHPIPPHRFATPTATRPAKAQTRNQAPTNLHDLISKKDCVFAPTDDRRFPNVIEICRYPLDRPSEWPVPPAARIHH